MRILISFIVMSIILVGCSSESTEQLAEMSEQTTPVLDSELNLEQTEFIGSGQSEAFSPYLSTAQITTRGSDVIAVDLDEFLEDGTSKTEASKAGTYTSPNYQLGEFYQQIESLESYIVENDKFPSLNNGIDVDGVSGASLNLSGFEEAYSLALQDIDAQKASTD